MDELPVEIYTSSNTTSNETNLFREQTPDILPIIARFAVGRGSTFKAFRSVCRLFKSVADKIFPTGDIDFANNRNTIFMKHNMVLNILNSVLMFVSELKGWKWSDELTIPVALQEYLSNISPADIYTMFFRLGPYDFDTLVFVLTPFYKHFNSPNFPRMPHKVQGVSDRLGVPPKAVKVAALLMNGIISNSFTQPTIISDLYDAIMNDLDIVLLTREYIAQMPLIQKALESGNIDFECLSSNPNITKEFYLAHQDEDWDYDELSMNPGLDFEFVETHFKKMCRFQRMDVPFEKILEYLPLIDNSENKIVLYCRRPLCVRTDKSHRDTETSPISDYTPDEKWEKILSLMRKHAGNFIIYEELNWKNYGRLIDTQTVTKLKDSWWFGAFSPL